MRLSAAVRLPSRFSTPRTRARIVLAVLAALVALPGSAWSAGPTNVSGTISTNTTWTLANSPYVMTGNVSVSEGVTLTIEPGVRVEANSTSRTLGINGSLSAVGTSSNHITFTSTTDTAAGQWHGIAFGGTGTSTLDYVDVRYGGGGGASHHNGMVEINGGTVTIENSSFKDSIVSGLRVFGDSTGAAATVTIRKSLFQRNGFNGTTRQGHGLNAYNGKLVVEDSAFWENAINGIYYWVTSTYTQAPAQISGSSMWKNKGAGVSLFQDSGVAALAPDGNIAGKPGNAIYDNGSFGVASGESWTQLEVSRESVSVDWRGTYWGPVRFVPCSLASQNGHLSYSAPDPNPSTNYPVERGPVSYDFQIAYVGGNFVWCGNDMALVNEPAAIRPDLYFDAPPAVFGGIPLAQTRGCACADDRQIASANDGVRSDGPVNTTYGALVDTALDLKLAGPGIPFAWTRTYNSQDSSSGALGVGWSHPFAANLTVVNATTGELEYFSGSGQRTRFTKTSGGGTGAATYAAMGFDGTLVRLSGGAYQLTTRDLRTLSFDSGGLLTQIKPRFLPATTLAYTSGKLSSITDSAGRAISISYVATTPALIERVTLPDGRYVEYGYTSGRLTSVRDPRGKSWILTYHATSGLLTHIQDPVGSYERQDIVYDGQGRVTSVEDGAGEAVTYSYATSAPYALTTVTQPGRGSWVYKHLGNLLVGVTDPLNRTYSYDPGGYTRTSTATDGRGNSWRSSYSASGNPVLEVAPSPAGFTLVRSFNSSNDVLTEQDGRGNTTTYAYATGSDPAADYQVGQLKTIADRENGVTTFKYWTSTSSPTPPATNVGLLKSTTDPRGKTMSFDYDSSGNLIKVTSPLGLKTTLAYDSSGRMSSRRDPRGNVLVPANGYLSEWTYDAVDHVATRTDARGNVTSFDYYDNELLWKTTVTDRGSTARVTTLEYESANRLWKTTDPRAGVETRLYWPDGRLKSLTTGAGRKTSYEYDGAGQLWKLVEPNGNAVGATASDYTWTYGYDANGNRTTESHPDGGERETFYDVLNRPYQWDDALEHRTSVSYDNNGNITSRTNGLSKTRTFTYDKLNRLLTEVDERGKTTTYEYFSTDQLKSVTSPLGNKTSFGLDDDGRITSMVEARGNAAGATAADYTWSYQFDEAGNRTRVTDPLGNYAQYAYDAVNSPTQVTDERGNTTDYTYDVLNRLWKVTPPAAGSSGTLYTEYGYDANGNLNSRTDPNGHTTSWTSHLDGLMTIRTTGVGTWNYGYDANGNLKTLESPAGSATGTVGDGTITYGYDRMSQQTSTNYSDATPDVSRTYDTAGRPATMVDGSGTVTYTHDNADRLTTIARTSGDSGLSGNFSYSYDDAGNILTRTLPDSTSSSYQYDNDGRLSKITAASADTVLAYDEAGNLLTTTLPSGNGHVETRSYDRAGRLTTVENKKSSTILSKYEWTLDAVGNPIKAKTTRGATDVYDVHDYDARNRLTAACYDLASSATSCGGATNAISYAYDKVTNRTQEIRAGSVGNTGAIDFVYNAADQLTSTTKSGTTTNYTYDANGNQATVGTRTYNYDLASRLASATTGGVTTTYGYDGNGRRLSSSTGGGGADLRFSWVELAASGRPELALERDTSGNLVRRYLNGPNGALNYTNTTATYWSHHDPLDTVTDVTDSGGVAQWRYEYEVYGAQRTATDVSGTAPTNPLRFNGQYLDGETANYHLRARQFDPATGRFGALDPIENPLADPYGSAYNYVNGRPTFGTDPLGLFCEGAKASVACGVAALEKMAGILDKAKEELRRITPVLVELRAASLKLAANLGTGFAGLADGATGGLSTMAARRMGIHLDASSTMFQMSSMLGSVGSLVTPAGMLRFGSRTAMGTVARNADEGQALYRSMRAGADGLPDVGPTARTLGARPRDIPVGTDGMVRPGTGGMSVTPHSPMKLPEHRRPKELGGTGKDPVWCLRSCDLGPDLTYRPDPLDPSRHGFIEPARIMTLDHTRLPWRQLAGGGNDERHVSGKGHRGS